MRHFLYASIIFGFVVAAGAQSYSPGLPLPGLPKSLGQKTMAQSTSVTMASNQSAITVTGNLTVTNPSVTFTGGTAPGSATNVGMTVSGVFVGLTGSANGLIVDGSAVVQPVSITNADTVRETRFHYAASQNINGSAGAWVALGSGAAVTVSVKQVQYSSTLGEPVEIGSGSGAASVTQRFIINQGGGPELMNQLFSSGTLLWVRSLSTSAISSGYLTVNLVGP